MSVDVMSAVWKESKATGSARLLLLAIADNANSDGKAYPSIKRLAQKVNTSERNIQFLLRKLVELGELAIELQAERRGCNAYYVLLGTNGGEEAFTRTVSRTINRTVIGRESARDPTPARSPRSKGHHQPVAEHAARAATADGLRTGRHGRQRRAGLLRTIPVRPP